MKYASYKALVAMLLPLLLSLGIMPVSLAASATRLTVDSSLGELLDNPVAKQVLLRHIEDFVSAPQIQQARGLSLRSVQKYAPDLLTDAVLARIDADLAREPTAVAVPGQAPVSPLVSPAKAFEFDTVRLWTGRAPLATGDAPQDVPTLTVIRPDAMVANGSAVIVAPGGGYVGLAGNHEGRMVGDWFAAHGFTAYVLTYRLTPHGYVHPTQLLDARRAVRWVRAHAKEQAIDPRRIVMIGFSAGAHLTAMASTLFDAGEAGADDPVERVSSRPDFAVLGYPSITKQLDRLKGPGIAAQAARELLPAQNLRPDSPPTFIFHTTTDEVVGPENAVAYYSALVAAKVPAELHIFEEGRHGLGLALGQEGVGTWPTLLHNWLRRHQLLPRLP